MLHTVRAFQLSWKARFVCTTVALLVVVTNSTAQRASTITLKPANAMLAEGFTMIASVRELADGRILITDEKENQIVVADLRSGAVNAISRLGSGPGEYRQVGRLWPMGGDSTIMSDRFERRWLIFDGPRIVATLPPTAPAPRATREGLHGADRNGRVVTIVAARNILGRRSPKDSMRVVRFDRTRNRTETIAKTTPEFEGSDSGVEEEASTGEVSSFKRVYSVAIIAQDQVAVFPDGWIAVARIHPYRVDWCAPGRRCTRGATLEPNAPMTQRAKRAYLELAAMTTQWPPTSSLDETSGWPDLIPPFVVPVRRLDAGALLPMPDGRLLIDRLTLTGLIQTHYDIVDRRGRLAGKIMLPPNEHIIAFGTKSVYVVVTDNVGLQRIRRHPWP